jgi:hypothetical protein
LSDFVQNWHWLIHFMKTSIHYISNTYIRLSSTLNTSAGRQAGRQAGTDMHSCPWQYWNSLYAYELVCSHHHISFVVIVLIPRCRKCACSGFILPSLFWTFNFSSSCCNIMERLFFYSRTIHSLHISWPPDSKGCTSIFR